MGCSNGTFAGDGPPFCANPDCALHVRAGDPGVEGFGNWAVLPSGLQVGRGCYGGRYLCDFCGTGRSTTANAPRRLSNTG